MAAFRSRSFLPCTRAQADRIAKPLKLIRLTQECLGQFGMIAGHHMGLVVAAGQDHREAGRQLSQRTSVSQPFMRGMVKSQSTQRTSSLCCTEYLHSLDAVLCQEHRKPEAHERAFAYFAHHRFVVNQQHRAARIDLRGFRRLVRLAERLFRPTPAGRPGRCSPGLVRSPP